MKQRNSIPASMAQWRRLFLAIGLLSFIWCVVLPKLGRTAPMRDMIDRNQAASIDPSALFYTDLEHLHYDGGILRHNHALQSDGEKQ